MPRQPMAPAPRWIWLTKASPATAQRDLADLVTKGCLVLVGSGRAAHYELAIA